MILSLLLALASPARAQDAPVYGPYTFQQVCDELAAGAQACLDDYHQYAEQAVDCERSYPGAAACDLYRAFADGSYNAYVTLRRRAQALGCFG